MYHCTENSLFYSNVKKKINITYIPPLGPEYDTHHRKENRMTFCYTKHYLVFVRFGGKTQRTNRLNTWEPIIQTGIFGYLRKVRDAEHRDFSAGDRNRDTRDFGNFVCHYIMKGETQNDERDFTLFIDLPIHICINTQRFEIKPFRLQSLIFFLS